MRRRLGRLFALIALALAVSAQTAQYKGEYRMISAGRDADGVITDIRYMDVTGVIALPNGSRRAWVWAISNPEMLRADDPWAMLGYVEFECGEKRLRPLQMTRFGIDGLQAGNEEVMPDPVFVPPGLRGEQELLFACGTTDDARRTIGRPLSVPTMDPLTHARALIFRDFFYPTFAEDKN